MGSSNPLERDGLDLEQILGVLPGKASVVAATVSALPANTYDNGSSGQGATLTGNSNGAFPTIDGVTISLDDRLLIKNESSAANNGIYTLTQVGDGSNPYILTRATDADTAENIVPNMEVVSQQGTVNADEKWQLTTDPTIVVGTTSLAFSNSSGNVSGPTTTNDNRLVRTNGTTGNIQQSGITVDDSDNISGANNITGGGIVSGDTLNATDDATTRTNLGLEIGSDVQAHSAVLDSTTASFTIALETKLNNIEANADVTDAANVLAAIAGATISAATVATTDQVLIRDVDDSNNVKTVTAQSIADLAAGGTGDVTGPGSSTDNTIARYSGTTGKIIQGSGVSIDDSNNVSGAVNITGTGVVTGATLNATDAATTRTNLGLAIGTNVQAFNAILQDIAGLAIAADKLIYGDGVNSFDTTDLTAFARTILDDANAAAVRTTISAQETLSGLSLTAVTVATDDKVLIQDTSDSSNIKTVTAQSIADLASGGAPRFSMGDMFTNSGRYVASGSGGSISFGNSGLFMSFTTSLVDHGRLMRLNGATSTGVFFDNNPIFNAILEVQAQPSGAGEIYFGLGEISSSTSGHTFTQKHIGFKIVWSGGTATVSGTVADGTTESTVALSGVTVTNQNYYSAVCDSAGGSVEFFVNGVSKGTVSANYPASSGANDILKFSQNSKSDSGSTIHSNFGGWEYSREA